MNDEEQKRYLLKRMKEIYRELTVYRAFASIAKEKGFQAEVGNEGFKDVDGLLESARQLPQLDKWVDSHFSGLEGLLGLTNESLLDQALQELLEKSYPNEPIN
ncbi:MAG: hypothetical protein ABSG62_00260 [Terracidiphilus sp.]|jgi:hypothetical protein